MRSWNPTSWQHYNYEQAATYPDALKLHEVIRQLSQRPPLVSHLEVDRLKNTIAMAGRGEAFLLQGGDCAESFDDCRIDVITNKLKILLQMSLVLSGGLQRPIIPIGRIAGQYAKPRSSSTETQQGITLPCYRGDLVNRLEFTASSRIPDPALLLEGYESAGMTLDYIRTIIANGFAERHLGPRSDSNHLPNPMMFYTSHEALHLHYEEALTRKISPDRWYNLSTHLPWVGVRTAKKHSAHIEYVRGIQNPIGIKVSQDTCLNWLDELLHELNPKGEQGRILLITRLGARHVYESLPQLIETVQKTQIPVTWSSDPMHGNTEVTQDGLKTRHFDTILSELTSVIHVHQQMGSQLGGVHFELTGDNVTECIGGPGGLNAEDLKHAYQSLVDPRLNYEQSLEMSVQLSNAFLS